MLHRPEHACAGRQDRAGTTLGPNCRVGGKVEASIFQGHSNKYHEGFLGHSYVGEWVNLGAGTQNSDLRNDYGDVSVTVNGQTVNTGQAKVGCFLGDHTKMGLGTLLNTGTNIGVCCNLLPSRNLRARQKYVPSYASWWNGQLIDRADLRQLVETATEVMAPSRPGLHGLAPRRDPLSVPRYRRRASPRRPRGRVPPIAPQHRVIS